MGTGELAISAPVALWFGELQHILMKVSRLGTSDSGLITVLSALSLFFMEHCFENKPVGTARPVTAAWMSRAVNGKVLRKEVIFPSAYQVVGDSKAHLILATLGSASKQWHAGISYQQFN